MIIQFNFAAFLQVVCVVLIMVLLTYAGIDTVFDSFGLELQHKNMVLFYICLIILGTTEIKGLRGRIFWLPTWIYLALLILIIGLKIENGFIKFANVAAVAAIAFFIIKIVDNKFKLEFEKCQASLNSIEKMEVHDMETRKQFWERIRGSYIFPSKIFLFAYPVFSIINRNSVQLQDFVSHYLKVIEKIKSEIYDPKDQMDIAKFENSLEYAKQFNGYSHQTFALTRLNEIIKKYSGK